MTAIDVALLTQACKIPDVIDVSAANRFNETVVIISIPTSAEFEKVKSLLTTNGCEYTLHIMPVFGLGTFTGNSKATREVRSLMHVSPYNVYGTPENRELEELMTGIEAREAEIWAAMTPDEKRAAIDKEVDRRRSAGRPDFGNCWIS